MERTESDVAGKRTTWSGRLRRLGLILFGSYAGVILVMLFFENWLVFHPTRASQDWQPAPSPDIQDVWLTTAQGTRIHAWWWPVGHASPPNGQTGVSSPRGSSGAILYCHGNAGNLSHRAGSIAKLRELLGESVLIFDYPGYGKSDGKPTEAGCYAAADAAYDWLIKEQRIDPERMILYGGSLGGAVAIDLAVRNEKYRALVLAKTFCSAPEIGQCLYPWLPVRWLMRNKFDNLGKIGRLRKPVFIGNAFGDCLIPFGQGERLFAAANEPKEFFRMEGDHGDNLPLEFFMRLCAFLGKCETCPPDPAAQK